MLSRETGETYWVLGRAHKAPPFYRPKRAENRETLTAMWQVDVPQMIAIRQVIGWSSQGKLKPCTPAPSTPGTKEQKNEINIKGCFRKKNTHICRFLQMWVLASDWTATLKVGIIFVELVWVEGGRSCMLMVGRWGGGTSLSHRAQLKVQGDLTSGWGNNARWTEVEARGQRSELTAVHLQEQNQMVGISGQMQLSCYYRAAIEHRWKTWVTDSRC